MRRATVLLAITALLALPAVALAAEQFAAELTADAEVPAPTVPGDFAGAGSAQLTVSDDGSSIDYRVTFDGLTGPVTMAHIHWGEEGAAGPPILWLTEMGVEDNPSPLTGTLTEADLQPAEGGPQTFAEAIEAMRAGSTYVNLHTEANPPGEIRGQVRLVPDTAASGEGATGAWLSLLVLVVAGASFIVAYRRLGAARPA